MGVTVGSGVNDRDFASFQRLSRGIKTVVQLLGDAQSSGRTYCISERDPTLTSCASCVHWLNHVMHLTHLPPSHATTPTLFVPHA